MLKDLVFIGVGIQILGNLVYIKHMFKGEAKPNRVTWLIWSIAPMIATAAAVSNGVGWAVLPVFAAGFGPFLVLVASFFAQDAYWELKKTDYLFFILSLMALVFWGLTQIALVAIAFAILSEIFGAIPTVIKSWKFPETESGFNYIASIFSVLTSFLAMEAFSISELAFPVYLVLLNSILIVEIYLMPLIRAKKKPPKRGQKS